MSKAAWGCVVGILVVAGCTSPQPDESEEPVTTRAAWVERSADTTSPPTTVSPTPEKYPWKFIPGNGTYQMGGIEGKNWGIWKSDGAEDGCKWSVRAVYPTSGAEIMDSGTAQAGDRPEVNIQPDGSVSVGGNIDGHRIVFMTNRCGAWRVT